MLFEFPEQSELEGAELLSVTLLEDHSPDCWEVKWVLADGSFWSSEWLGMEAAKAFCIAQIGEEAFAVVAPPEFSPLTESEVNP